MKIKNITDQTKHNFSEFLKVETETDSNLRSSVVDRRRLRRRRS